MANSQNTTSVELMKSNTTLVDSILSTVVVVNNQQPSYRSKMGIGQRITERLLNLRKNQTWLADKSGVEEGTISALVVRDSGRTKYAVELAAALAVRTEWLINGELPQTSERDDWPADSNRTAFAINSPSLAYDSPFVFVARLLNRLGAGAVHAEEFDEVGGRHAFRKDWIIKKGFNPTLLRVLDVEGDSMSPYINDGDVVLVNTDDKRIINQEVYAIRVQDELMVKRLFKQMDGRVRVISDNPDKNSYPDDWLTPDSGAEILGKVVHRAG